MKMRAFILVAGLFTITASSLGDKCPNQKQTAARFVLSSRRNQTGHWIAEVRLEHKNDGRPWTVEVDESATQCEGQKDTVQIVASIVSPPPRAGPGYELYPKIGYYKLHRELKTWEEARRICQEEGAHLAIINSEEESQVLRNMFAPVAQQLKVAWAFIGFHDLYQEGQYLTIFDEPLSSTGFIRWSSSNQPDNAGGNETAPGEDCGSMHTNGGINDLTCTAKVPFICEQELW